MFFQKINLSGKILRTIIKIEITIIKIQIVAVGTGKCLDIGVVSNFRSSRSK